MRLSSSAFQNMQTMPAQFTCAGENISPPLSVDGAPAEAKSLALIMHDPDATGGEDFKHWVVWAIDPATKEILEGGAPSGSSEGLNDFGRVGYGGPCPHQGRHRYVFELFALDTALELPSTTSAQKLAVEMDGHVLAHATLTGLVRAVS